MSGSIGSFNTIDGRLVGASIVRRGSFVSPPDVPVNLVLSDVTDTTLTLAWDASPGASSYSVYRDDVLVGTVDDSVFDDTGLTHNSDYSYRVVAVNAGGSSDSSESVVARTAVVVDAFIDMDGETVGDLLSAANVGSGTNGSVGTITPIPSPMEGLRVAENQFSRLRPVKVGSTVYGVDQLDRAWICDHQFSADSMEIRPGATTSVWTIAGIFQTDLSDLSPSSQLNDFVNIRAAITGRGVIMQLKRGGGAEGYSLNIEAVTASGTLHSEYIPLEVDSVYRWCLQSNHTTGIARLAVYDAAGTQLALVNVTQASGETLFRVNLGQSRPVTAPGMRTFLQSMVFIYSDVFPVLI